MSTQLRWNVQLYF